MNVWIVLAPFILTGSTSFSQVTDSTEQDTSYYIVYIPKHSWSVGIGYSSLPAIFTDGAYAPDNFEIQAWLTQRFYLQAGAFFQSDEVSPNNYFFDRGFAVYAGTTFKLFLFNNAYFVPSWNIHFDKYPDDFSEEWAITTGPGAAFEFFIHNKFSVSADLLNVNYGYVKGDSLSSNTRFTIHRALGLSLRYNFDLRKPG